MFSVDSIWAAPDDDARNIAWTRDFWQQLEPHGDRGRIYMNFPGHGEDAEALMRATFGDNYRRLAEVKRRYDPDNVFRFNQNIRPEA